MKTDLTQLFAGPFGVPAMNFQELVALQQRNLSAFAAANAQLIEGAQALLARQAELVNAAMTESLAAARDSLSGQPLDVEKQMALFKASTEKNIANARAMAEIAGKSGSAALEILRKRASDSVSELGELFKAAA
ncbi:MAG: TIGR01841 family phasin [Rhodospirillales bacterium]|nr:TIGR01841 family phasin [Rhodospirillales bacterium]